MPRPLARVLALLEILQSGGLHRLAELSDDLGVDERTVRRYVAHLVDLDIPVESVRGRYGGYRLAPGFRLPPLMLTDDEALAVLVGLSSASSGGEGRASATAKILRVLPPASREKFEALLLTADLSAAGEMPTGRPGELPETAILLTVAAAAGARTPLLIRYTDREARGSHRRVLPYGVVARGGRWYLSAADSLSGKVRTFRIDRIRSADPEDGTFEVPAGLEAAGSPARLAHWRHAVSVRVEGSVEQVQARLPAGLARVSDLGDGWVRVELRAERLDWVPAVLSGLDRPFRVEAPAELRDQVRLLGERLLAIAAVTVTSG